MSTRANEIAHRTLVIVGAAVILLGTSGIAAMTAWMPSSASLARVGTEAEAAPAPAEGEPRVRVKCAECGIVASKRQIEQAGAASKRFEITVRMMDGSSRAFMDANPANWRPGQRVILIDGAGSLSTTRG